MSTAMGPINTDRLVEILEMTAEQLREELARPTHTIALKEAAYIAGVSEAQMRKRCEVAVYQMHQGGYGVKRLGTNRWEVVLAPFLATVTVSDLSRVKWEKRALTRD